jgi:hypothetical protein
MKWPPEWPLSAGRIAANPCEYTLYSASTRILHLTKAMAILDQYPRVKERAKALAEKARPLFNRRAFSLALVVIGVVLLGYVAAQYWGMYRSQKNLEAEWQRQAATVSVPGKAPVSPDQMLTRLQIPKIQMDAIVVEGASRRELSEGPGHMK